MVLVARRLILLVLPLLAIACQRNEKPLATALPSRDAYAGAQRCGECHEKNHAKWSEDWHARALSPAEAKYAVGRFDSTHYRGASSEAWMERRDDAFVMITEPATGPPTDFTIDWLVGGKRMQDAVTMFPDGRWQVLPVYYHVTGKGEWVDYNEKKQGLVTKDHPFFWTNFRRTANHACLYCHVTGLDVSYNRTEKKWTTHFADPGVSCEGCHGPGARHSITKAKDDIVRADELDRDRALALCGQCHGPREPIYPLFDTAHAFHPGDLYDDKLQPLVIVDGTERSGEFFADGRPSSSSFEYQALLQSRCYMQGNATCLSCHNAPHAKHAANEVKPSTCETCHAAIVAAGAKHTHHTSAAAQSCVACHMPPVVSGVLDHFADHTIDIPNPRNTIAHGVPNACNVCHQDKTPQAMESAIASWWPNASARTARRSQLADAIDEKTRDASEPALLAVIRDRAEAPTLRGAAAILLAQRFGKDAPGAVEPLLREVSPLLRSRSIEALGYANAKGSADAIAALLDDPAVKVRERAAVVLSMFGDPRAQSALERLASNPNTETLVWPHILLGTSAAQRGDLDRAEREMNRALDIVPYNPDALVFLADIRMRRHDPVHARAYVEEALRFDPRHRGANRRLQALPR